jgi:hypothetical protein
MHTYHKNMHACYQEDAPRIKRRRLRITAYRKNMKAELSDRMAGSAPAKRAYHV